MSLYRPPRTPIVPFVSAVHHSEGRGGPPQPGFFGGWLGRTYDPLFVLRDPNAPGFGMPELTLANEVDPQRMLSRRGLAEFPHTSKLADRALQDMNGFQTRAFDLLTSPASQRAFHVNQEPPGLRDRYGRNIYGQSVLLARRLIEAGSRVACQATICHDPPRLMCVFV